MMNADHAYASMMEQLGYSDSGYLRAILEYLMTNDQAAMVASLPGTAKEVAEKTGFNEDKVKKELDALLRPLIWSNPISRQPGRNRKN